MIVPNALIGLISSMARMPMLNICTPPPDMYSINAFMGSDLPGVIAISQARFCFSLAYDSAAKAECATEVVFFCGDI